MWWRRFTILNSVALLVMVALLVTACAGEAPPAPVPPAAEEPAAEEVVVIEEVEEVEEQLSGEIIISLASNDVQTYQAMADVYMAMHPGGECIG